MNLFGNGYRRWLAVSGDAPLHSNGFSEQPLLILTYLASTTGSRRLLEKRAGRAFNILYALCLSDKLKKSTYVCNALL